MYWGFINLHLTFYEWKTFQNTCKFLKFFYSESQVQAVQFYTLLHKIGVLQLEKVVESLQRSRDQRSIAEKKNLDTFLTHQE